MNPIYLTEDLAEIELPGRCFIDIGWTPSRDPSGQFVVTLFRGNWDHIIDEKSVKSLSELVSVVEHLAMVCSMVGGGSFTASAGINLSDLEMEKLKRRELGMAIPIAKAYTKTVVATDARRNRQPMPQTAINLIPAYG